MMATVGRDRQSWMLPVSEFYLAGSRGNLTIAFVCTASLTEGFNRAAVRWGSSARMQDQMGSHHASSTPLNPPSASNRAWVEAVYANDVNLHRRYCPWPNETTASVWAKVPEQ